MENLIFAMGIAAVTFALAYQIAILARDQKKLKRNIKKMEDFNVEFRGTDGSVSKQRKNYGQLKDDFRERSDSLPETDEMTAEEFKLVDEPTLSQLRDAQDREERHSIAGHMNDPSEIQKKAFLKANDVPA